MQYLGNANYLLKRLEPYYDLPYPGPCMHECVFSARRQKQREALMIEPTETEAKETLDAFAEAMIQIAREAETDPLRLCDAPLTTPVRRLDQTRAARQPDLRWTPPR